MKLCRIPSRIGGALAVGLALSVLPLAAANAQAQKRPNVVMLMTDDTGWNDFGPYSNGGKALGHPTPNVDKIAEEGGTFTNWYGQASCTAGRASFITGRIPIRSALSIVVAPSDPNMLRKETPTIAEFFKKNGYSTYSSGKWHLGDKPKSYPIEHGFDEMKNFAAYYAGVYTYDYTNKWFHPWFPSYNPQFAKAFSENVNLNEWEGVAGQPAKDLGKITYERFATFDEDQAANAVKYIQAHAKDDKPFFMDVNYLKMHNPTNAAPDFAGKSHLGDYSNSLMELDADIGKVMDEIRKDAPNTIVIVTADNGAWLDAYPDAGTTPFRGEKGSPFEGGWRVPGIMWWPGHIAARSHYDEMMSHIDAWATLAAMVGLTPPPHEWVGNDGKPIYFDSIDNSAYILGKAEHSARRSWIYIDGETFQGMRADVAGDPAETWVNIAWKYLYTAKNSWLGPNSGPRFDRSALQSDHGPLRKIRHDVQRRGAGPGDDDIAGTVRGSGQRLGAGDPCAGGFGLRQVDHEVPEYPALRRRRLQRPDSEPAASRRSGPAAEAADRADGRTACPGQRRLIVA